MDWFKRNPIFYVLLCSLLVATVGGMWYASKDVERLASLKEQYEIKHRQLQLFLTRSPAPTKANLEQLDRNYDDLVVSFANVQSALNLNTYDGSLFFGEAPASRNDAFFMIAKYVEDARNLAITSGVKHPEDGRYGFSEYENVGPEEEVIDRVHRQAKIMESLLLALFDSGISEFVSIRRESSVPGETVSTGEGDIFNRPSKRSENTTEAFDSLAFRLEFKGQSLALRSFLNRVSSSSLPFSISEIEVRLERETGSEKSRSAILDNPFANPDEDENTMSAVRVPIIAENESYFVVTLEFLELRDGVIAVRNLLEGGKSV